MAGVLIELRKVTKAYSREVVPVRDLDLVVEAGDFISVAGPSGCGKSTLLNIAGCLARPDRGRVLILGQDTATLDDARLAEVRNRHIGFIFQGSYLIPALSGLENILSPLYFSRRISRVALQQWRRRAMELAERLGIDDCLDRLPHQLSLGQRRRVALARALIRDPELILADEPTNDLDPERASQIGNILVELYREGRTLLVVTHHPDLAARAARRFRLQAGRLVPEVQVDTGPG